MLTLQELKFLEKRCAEIPKYRKCKNSTTKRVLDSKLVLEKSSRYFWYLTLKNHETKAIANKLYGIKLEG